MYHEKIYYLRNSSHSFSSLASVYLYHFLGVSIRNYDRSIYKNTLSVSGGYLRCSRFLDRYRILFFSYGRRLSSSSKASLRSNTNYSYLERLVPSQAKISILGAPSVTRPTKSFFPVSKIFAHDNSETQKFFAIQILNRFENQFEAAYSATSYNFNFDKFIRRFRRLTRYNFVLHSKINYLYTYERLSPSVFVYDSLFSGYKLRFINFSNSEFSSVTSLSSTFLSRRHRPVRSLYRYVRFLNFYHLSMLISSDLIRFKIKIFYFRYNLGLTKYKFFDLIVFDERSFVISPFISNNFYRIRSLPFFMGPSVKGLKVYKSLHIRPLFKMPQLDLYSIASQFFWGIAFFCVFYYVITFYFIPSIFTILYARNYYTGGSSEVNSFVISYIFISQAINNVLYVESLEITSSAIDVSVQTSFVTSFLLSDIFHLEFADVFDESYNFDQELGFYNFKIKICWKFFLSIFNLLLYHLFALVRDFFILLLQFTILHFLVMLLFFLRNCQR